MDLLKQLAERARFDYEIVLPSDGFYGSKQPDGSWNGVVGDLVRGVRILL